MKRIFEAVGFAVIVTGLIVCCFNYCTIRSNVSSWGFSWQSPNYVPQLYPPGPTGDYTPPATYQYGQPEQQTYERESAPAVQHRRKVYGARF